MLHLKAERDAQTAQTVKDNLLLSACGHATNPVPVVRFLLSQGANANARDENGFTPLHMACSRGHVETLDELLKCGPNVDAQDQLGQTALHYSAAKDSDHTAKVLIAAGADRAVATRNGRLPFDFASSPEMQMLLNPSLQGASLQSLAGPASAVNPQPRSDACRARLLAVNAEYERKQTHLMNGFTECKREYDDERRHLRTLHANERDALIGEPLCGGVPGGISNDALTERDRAIIVEGMQLSCLDKYALQEIHSGPSSPMGRQAAARASPSAAAAAAADSLDDLQLLSPWHTDAEKVTSGGAVGRSSGQLLSSDEHDLLINELEMVAHDKEALRSSLTPPITPTLMGPVRTPGSSSVVGRMANQLGVREQAGSMARAEGNASDSD